MAISRSRYICQRCRQIFKQPLETSRWHPRLVPRMPDHVLLPQRPFSIYRQLHVQSAKLSEKDNTIADQAKQFWGTDWTVFSADNSTLVTKAQSLGNSILIDSLVPSEQEVHKVLEFIKYAALQLNVVHNTRDNHGVQVGSGVVKSSTRHRQPISQQDVESSRSNNNLLSGIRLEPCSSKVSLSIATKLLSSLSYKIVKHAPVFLSPKVLDLYVTIQISLGHLSTLAEIFDLYAYKPALEPGSFPFKYVEPNPNKAKQAIPERLASQALDAAISAKNLTLALDIISSAYAAPAFRRHKFIRKALPLLTAIGLVPATALPIAREWATTSFSADPTELMIYTFMGIMTYASSVFSLGYIALTTHNDQMQRVSWMPGMPLKDRWMREEERAAADRLALAWGFKDINRRGEEEGEEWAVLREWCGMRGMFVDATELMEGME